MFLSKFDDQLRSAVCSICVIDRRLQASLPVRNCGLGIRRVASLRSSAFLASAAGTRGLQDRILHRMSSVNERRFLGDRLYTVNHKNVPVYFWLKLWLILTDFYSF